MIGNIIVIIDGDKLALLARSVIDKMSAVRKPRAALVSEKINKHLVLRDILRPCAVEGNRRLIRADMSRDVIVHVVGTV